MQTPKVNVLWDCKYFADDAEGQSGKYTVQFSLTDMENNKKMTCKGLGSSRAVFLMIYKEKQ